MKNNTSVVKTPSRVHRVPAMGTNDTGSGHPKICIRFDRKQFDKINSHAAASNISFAEAVRSLVDYAFDHLENDDGAAA